MSILSKSKSNSSSSSNMCSSSSGTPSFHEFKKQASFFFKEKIKSARLALTDATPAQFLTEEATSGNLCVPDTRTLVSISRDAFEVDDYWRIVEILHKRFLKFERKNWRVSYNSIIVLERLLTHGPESLSREFQIDRDVIKEMENFQYIDEKGFNWGLSVRNKAERILKLLEEGELLKDERQRARKLTREIKKGFGSFCQRSSSEQVLQESSLSCDTFARCYAKFGDSWENQFVSSTNEEDSVRKVKTLQKTHEDAATTGLGREKVNLNSWNSISSCDAPVLEKPETTFKENMAPEKRELDLWNCTGEVNPLLEGRRDEVRIVEEDHPFDDNENQTSVSLLQTRRNPARLQTLD